MTENQAQSEAIPAPARAGGWRIFARSLLVGAAVCAIATALAFTGMALMLYYGFVTQPSASADAKTLTAVFSVFALPFLFVPALFVGAALGFAAALGVGLRAAFWPAKALRL